MELIAMAEDDLEALDNIAKLVARFNQKWWHDLETGKPLDRNIGEMLMLVTSELAEAMEGHRKNLMDDKLKHRKMFDVELVDAFIRLFDIVGHLVPDFSTIFEEKMIYNSQRFDHTIEGRKQVDGKKY